MGGASWAEWTAEGIEKGSIVADPCVTIVNKKMTTCQAHRLMLLALTRYRRI